MLPLRAQGFPAILASVQRRIDPMAGYGVSFRKDIPRVVEIFFGRHIQSGTVAGY